MLWTIEGADLVTGEARVIVVEAMNEPAAAEAARIAGVVASKILPRGGAPISQVPMMPQPMGYATSSGKYGTTPDYKLVRVGSIVVKVIGIILFAISGLCVIGGGIIGIFGAAPYRNSEIILVVSALYGLVFAIWGFLFMYVGALGVAIRDAARNSFYR